MSININRIRYSVPRIQIAAKWHSKHRTNWNSKVWNLNWTLTHSGAHLNCCRCCNSLSLFVFLQSISAALSIHCNHLSIWHLVGFLLPYIHLSIYLCIVYKMRKHFLLQMFFTWIEDIPCVVDKLIEVKIRINYWSIGRSELLKFIFSFFSSWNRRKLTNKHINIYVCTCGLRWTVVPVPVHRYYHAIASACILIIQRACFVHLLL